LRDRWCVGRSRLGVKNWGWKCIGRRPIKNALRLLADFVTHALMESTLSRMTEKYSSG
jgi:hypothetical protein